MTAIPRADDHAVDLIVICDQCGTSLRAKGLPAGDFRLVWQAALHIGWSGVERPMGPHYCLPCGVASSGGGDRGVPTSMTR